MQNKECELFTIEGENIKGCKVDSNNFKRFKPYTKLNLKRAYAELTGISTKANINFFMSKGVVVLIPETGKGFEADFEIMRENIK